MANSTDQHRAKRIKHQAAGWALTLRALPVHSERDRLAAGGINQVLGGSTGPHHRLHLPLLSLPSAVEWLHGAGPWSEPDWHPPPGWPGHSWQRQGDEGMDG